MSNKLTVMLLCAVLLFPVSVKAEVLDYQGTVNAYKQDNQIPQVFEVDNGNGKAIEVMAKKDTVYVSSKYTTMRTNPGKNGTRIKRFILGTELQRVAVCSNNWSKIIYESKGEKFIGYVPNKYLSDTSQLVKVRDTLKAVKDCDILDYPSRKDGVVVGEVLEQDEIYRTATINNIWSRISYINDQGKKRTGYIPTNVLEGQENVQEVSIDTIATVDGEEAGVLHKSAGEGLFAEAVDGVTADTVKKNKGVNVGTPVSASSDATLKPLGTFRITHYCPCSICCGPWANGITSTGVTATTNRTIAVDPTQIPYGSKVVINGQVYVAEDCGGAIKTNCIDIYVATHEEGESKGVFYTEVYLLQ